MLCLADDEIADELRWSSQLPAPAEVTAVGDPQQRAKQLPLRCESFNDVNCDVGIPDGEPRAPRTLDVQRPVAMLPVAMPSMRAQRSRLPRVATDTKINSEFPDSIFRPPRRS
tara:strand:- start:58202 stop:58540 length:339 start_codon:yes stop_codon:yes gene_type:complete